MGTAEVKVAINSNIHRVTEIEVGTDVEDDNLNDVGYVVATTDAVTGVNTIVGGGARVQSIGDVLLAKKGSGVQYRNRLWQSNAAGSNTTTWHSTFMASGDFYAVQPIMNVVTMTNDGTYTTDDIYDHVAVAPTNAVLTGGLPDASGGNGTWVDSVNMTIPRAAVQTPAVDLTHPLPTVGSLIYCSSIARTDGGPGRLLMARAYVTSIATSRAPTYFDVDGTLANNQLWDNVFPLAAMGQHYYVSNQNYASASQGSFGAAATRWANTPFVGIKFHYNKPHLTVLNSGDSIMGGNYAESGVPISASMFYRAVYDLQVAGYPIDLINLGSGAGWDVFTAWLKSVVPQVKPDVVILPVFTVNGVSAGVGVTDTVATADKHWAQASLWRDWCLANGCAVLFVTPCPKSTFPTVVPLLCSRLIASGFPYADVNSVVADATRSAWLGGYSTDGTHPLQVANVAAKELIKTALKRYF